MARKPGPKKFAQKNVQQNWPKELSLKIALKNGIQLLEGKVAVLSTVHVLIYIFDRALNITNIL